MHATAVANRKDNGTPPGAGGFQGRRTALPGPEERRAARPGGRNHRCRQVRVPAVLGDGHGSRLQPGPGQLPVRGLQGRCCVRRLHQPAAHRRPGHRPVPAPGAPGTDVAARGAPLPRAAAEPEKSEGPAGPAARSRSRGAAVPHHHRGRIRGARQRSSRVRGRRGGCGRPRTVAGPAPDPGHPAPGRRHQGQPACQHQPARGAAHGRRGRRHGHPGCPGRGVLRSGHSGPRSREDRPGPDPGFPDRLRRRLDHGETAAAADRHCGDGLRLGLQLGGARAGEARSGRNPQGPTTSPG